MKYKELIDLGFERIEMNCTVFFTENGYYDFYLQYKLNKKLIVEWNLENKDFVKLVRYDGVDVQNYIKIKDIKTVKALIEFFTVITGNNEPKQMI